MFRRNVLLPSSGQLNLVKMNIWHVLSKLHIEYTDHSIYSTKEVEWSSETWNFHSFDVACIAHETVTINSCLHYYSRISKIPYKQLTSALCNASLFNFLPHFINFFLHEMRTTRRLHPETETLLTTAHVIKRHYVCILGNMNYRKSWLCHCQPHENETEEGVIM